MLLSDIVRLNGRKTPSRTAIITGERTVTFGELRDSAWRVANAMLELAEPGDRVGILAENIPEYVECYYGVPAAGMALTFLNYRLHPKEWVWILNNAEARVLIVEQKYLEHIEPLLGDIADDAARDRDRRRPGSAGRYPSYADVVGAADVPTNRPATSTRTRPPGCSTPVARPGSPRARCSPTATSPWRCWRRSSSTSRSPTSATWWRSRCATSPDTPCPSPTCAAAGSC